MVLNLVEELSCFIVHESIRDEALGDLWEADHKLHVSNVHALWRNLITLWNFVLIVKASLAIEFDALKESATKVYERLFKGAREIDQNFDMEEIDVATLQFLKRYCDFRLLGSQQSTAAQWVSSYINKTKIVHSSDDRLMWLVKKADKLIDRCQTMTGSQGDSESVINSLLLSNFIRRLESNPPTQIDAQTFLKLVNSVDLTREFINKYVGFSEETFSRKLIIRTWSLTLYVISWEPGQRVDMHHHGNALDAIRVIQGEMAHWLIAPEDREEEIPFEGGQSTERCHGEPQLFSDGEVALVDRRYGHQIANLSDERLITLHVRFGLPPEDDHWRSTADELKFVWEQIEFVWSQPLQHAVG